MTMLSNNDNPHRRIITACGADIGDYADLREAMRQTDIAPLHIWPRSHPFPRVCDGKTHEVRSYQS
jgi:hypothetical protein